MTVAGSGVVPGSGGTEQFNGMQGGFFFQCRPDGALLNAGDQGRDVCTSISYSFFLRNCPRYKSGQFIWGIM